MNAFSEFKKELEDSLNSCGAEKIEELQKLCNLMNRIALDYMKHETLEMAAGNVKLIVEGALSGRGDFAIKVMMGLIEGHLTMGANLYRQALIESGVDVIALEKNLKPIGLVIDEGAE